MNEDKLNDLIHKSKTMSEYLDPEDEVIRLIFVDCILPICDQKRCYLCVAIISSKELFIMHGVMNFKST